MSNPRTPTTDEMAAHLACDGDLRAQLADAVVLGDEAQVYRDIAEVMRHHFAVADDGAIVPASGQRTFLDFYGGDYGRFTPITRTDKE